MKEKCSVKGCNEFVRCKGLCSIHYSRNRRLGSVGPAWRLHNKMPFINNTCRIEGCGRKAVSKHLCEMHYARHLRKGDTGPAWPLSIPGRICSVPECGRRHSTRGLCQMHWFRKLKHGDVGPPGPYHDGNGYINENGYRMLRKVGHPNAYKDGTIAEHTVVMSEILGRPLMKGETVHHKNGNRSDNRPANLELWAKRHGHGQRAVDKIADAVHLLTVYAKDDALWPYRTEAIRKLFVAIGLIELAQRMLASEAENHEANAPGRKDPK